MTWRVPMEMFRRHSNRPPHLAVAFAIRVCRKSKESGREPPMPVPTFDPDSPWVVV